MSLDDDLRTIQQRISQVQAKRARAAVEKDNALAKIAESKAVLKEEFGVDTTEEAQLKQSELEDALTQAVNAVEEALALAGA